MDTKNPHLEGAAHDKIEAPSRNRVADFFVYEKPKWLSLEVPMETRKKWTEDIQKAIEAGSDAVQSIRPWNVVQGTLEEGETHVPDAANSSGFFDKAGNYIRANPGAFALQATGAALVTTSLVAMPVLGAVGFTASGPAAGSVAAAWQASLGSVQAGSLFAGFQSAVMGGAAASSCVTAGAAGIGVAGAGTAATIPGWKEKASGAFKFVSDAVRGNGEKAEDGAANSEEATFSENSENGVDNIRSKL